jgi:hypothetical protein
MTNVEAMKVATAFVSTQELRGFLYTCVGAKKSKQAANEWDVVFDVRDDRGHLIDGPVIVLVDDLSGGARFFGGM